YGLPFIRRVFDEVEFENWQDYSTVRLSKRIIPPVPTDGAQA
ncbi:MAG: hypothetical protein QOG92_618, partial [Verrucomicrobiota bacterium]|nr:hypothetical protein [Verrucomicrobiota bacterium]